MAKKIITLFIMIFILSSGLGASAQTAGEHIIQAGDTLQGISRQYDTSVPELLDLNPGIDARNLQIGQKIALPLYSYHIIQPGDNIRSLALQYRVPLASVLKANGMAGEKVSVGEMIRIPMHFYQKEEGPQVHHVEIGDTLYKIALQYKVGLGQLLEWNGLTDMDLILAGQTLIVG